jgi:hypothetical protein
VVVDDRSGGDDQAAVGAGIDQRAEAAPAVPAGVAQRRAVIGVPEVQVGAAGRGAHGVGVRERLSRTLTQHGEHVPAVADPLGDPCGRQDGAGLVQVEVDDDQTGRAAGSAQPRR